MKVVSVKFKENGRAYYFDPGEFKIKAAGGISTVEDIEKFLDLGADRLGTSRAVKLLTSGEAGSGY